MNTLSQSFLYNLLENLHGLFVVMNAKSEFVYSNQYTAKMFGYSCVDKMIGLNAYHMQCPAVESAPEFISQDRKVLATNTPLIMLDIHEYADGHCKILLTKKYPSLHEDKLEVVCHCTEINSTYLQKVCSALINSDEKYHGSKNNRSYTINQITNEFEVLTNREMDCLFYMLRGQTRKQIGKSLFISDRTVETHIESIKSKWNCYDKSAIIEHALMNGYLNYLPQNIVQNNLSYLLA